MQLIDVGAHGRLMGSMDRPRMIDAQPSFVDRPSFIFRVFEAQVACRHASDVRSGCALPRTSRT